MMLIVVCPEVLLTLAILSTVELCDRRIQLCGDIRVVRLALPVQSHRRQNVDPQREITGWKGGIAHFKISYFPNVFPALDSEYAQNPSLSAKTPDNPDKLMKSANSLMNLQIVFPDKPPFFTTLSGQVFGHLRPGNIEDICPIESSLFVRNSL